MTGRTGGVRAGLASSAFGGVLRAEPRVILDFMALAKPRVVLLVVLTTAAGFCLASVGGFDATRLVHALVGTGLAAAGTLALNQYLERDVDARMPRTRLRPLPAGRLRPIAALWFGGLLLAIGLADLALGAGLGAALVTALTAMIYLGGYTPLKQVTPLCTAAGAVAGALPPVTGWLAAADAVGPGAGILFGILFLWQVPHTLAIGRLYRDDYGRAGIRVLPVVDPTGVRTAWYMVGGCLGLLVAGALPSAIGLTGSVALGGGLGLGLVFLGTAVVHAARRSRSTARGVLWGSLAYLPVLILLMTLDKLGR